MKNWRMGAWHRRTSALSERGEERRKRLGVCQMCMGAEELQLAGRVCRRKLREHQPAEQLREHAHGQTKVELAWDLTASIPGKPAAWHDHVDMRMMRHCRAPAVQHRGDADAGAEMLGIRRDSEHRLCRGREQKIVDHGLVVVGDLADRHRQRKDDMEIGTGSSSASRAAIHSRAAAPWHLGQCRWRQLL